MLTTAQSKAMLAAIGFDNASRTYSTAVAGFQTGWNLGAPLVADGKFGPLTSNALALSYARLRKGLPTMSANFSYTEFRCKCGGRYANCRRIWEIRAHIRRLEALRSKNGPVRIVSGCRCPSYNHAVGGASSSQHQFGGASDIAGQRSVTWMRNQRLFAGIGYNNSSKLVVHVDSRDVAGHNTTGGTPARPTTWVYSR